MTRYRRGVLVVRTKPSTTGTGTPKWPEPTGSLPRRDVEATVWTATATSTVIVRGAAASVVALLVHGRVGETRGLTVGDGVVVVISVVVVVAIAVYSVAIQLCEVLRAVPEP